MLFLYKAYAVSVMPMKKIFPLIGTVVIFLCGSILRITPTLSDKAAWSYLVGSVNASPWELYKPYAIIYIGWIIIELSCLRPPLTHFVSAKLTGLLLLCTSVLTLGTIFCSLPFDLALTFPLAGLSGIILAQVLSYRLNHSTIRIEILLLPLLIMLFCMIMLLLILSFYPPHWGIFYDSVHHRFGRG